MEHEEPGRQDATPLAADADNPIERALNDVSRDLAVAERHKEYKATLEALLQKIGSALNDYTNKKYAELLQRWQDQEQGLMDLVATLTSRMPDWEVRLQMAVGPLLARLVKLDQQLGEPTEPAPPQPHTSDGLYTRRDREQVQLARAQARYDRARNTLDAWSQPAQTLEKILDDNDKLASEIKKGVGQQDAPSLLYDMFFKLLPMHAHIAPPARQKETHAQTYVTRAAGDAAWRLVLASIGPQPSLIEPAVYLQQFGKKPFAEYTAAQGALAKADGDLKRTLEETRRAEKARDEQRKAIDKLTRAALLAPAASTPAYATAATLAASAVTASAIQAYPPSPEQAK